MTRRSGTLLRVSAPALALVLAGCSYLGRATSFDPAELDSDDGWRSVRDVPVLRQKGDTDCGPAALGMVLAYWMVPLGEGELAGSFSTAGTDGVKARELRDFARAKGLQSYLFRGRFDDLEREIGEGHPVLVGLVKPYVTGALTHYEVVVAVHPGLQKVVTLDPGHGWRQNSFDGFRLEWEPSGFLTMVFYREERPARRRNP